MGPVWALIRTLPLCNDFIDLCFINECMGSIAWPKCIASVVRQCSCRPLCGLLCCMQDSESPTEGNLCKPFFKERFLEPCKVALNIILPYFYRSLIFIFFYLSLIAQFTPLKEPPQQFVGKTCQHFVQCHTCYKQPIFID